jgi:hypothetical protein
MAPPRRRKGKGLTNKQKSEVRELIDDNEPKRVHVEVFSLTDIPLGGTLHSLAQVDGTSPTDDRGHRESFQQINKYLRSLIGIIPGDNTNVVRVMLFRAEDEVSITDMCELYGFINATTMKDKGIYILDDRHYSLSKVATEGTTSNQSFRTIIYKDEEYLKNMKTIYTGNTAADCHKGFIYLYLVSDSVAAPHPRFEGDIQISFTS